MSFHILQTPAIFGQLFWIPTWMGRGVQIHFLFSLFVANFFGTPTMLWVGGGKKAQKYVREFGIFFTFSSSSQIFGPTQFSLSI